MGIARRTHASAQTERYGTLHGQRQNLGFLESYNSDDSFAQQGAQPTKKPTGAFPGRAMNVRPKQGPYGAFAGNQIKFQPKKPQKSTFPGRGYSEFRNAGLEDVDYEDSEDPKDPSKDSAIGRLIHAGRAYAVSTSKSGHSHIFLTYGRLCSP